MHALRRRAAALVAGRLGSRMGGGGGHSVRGPAGPFNTCKCSVLLLEAATVPQLRQRPAGPQITWGDRC